MREKDLLRAENNKTLTTKLKKFQNTPSTQVNLLHELKMFPY